MILATHALTGAVIGKNFNNPGLIIILSLAAHFLMDALRHGEYFDSRTARVKNTAWKVALDLSAAFLTILIFIYFKNPDFETMRNIFLGMFISALPDGLTLLHWKFPVFKSLKKLKQFHDWTHYYSRFPKHSPERQWTLRNARNDILISLACIVILFFL
jgi:hypothetical protein